MLTTPTVSSSDLPGLLGLAALRRNNAVLDFQTLKLHVCGPGGSQFEKHLPPDTDSFQLEVAPSGHLLLPCCEYQTGQNSSEDSLTLIARAQENSGQTTGQNAGNPGPPAHAPQLEESAGIQSRPAGGTQPAPLDKQGGQSQ